MIWGEKAEAIGGRLLISGWWGIGRHLNYTGEIGVYLALTLATGFGSFVPYLLPLWMLVLLAHRAARDDRRCRAKYGAALVRLLRAHALPHVPVSVLGPARSVEQVEDVVVAGAAPAPSGPAPSSARDSSDVRARRLASLWTHAVRLPRELEGHPHGEAQQGRVVALREASVADQRGEDPARRVDDHRLARLQLECSLSPTHRHDDLPLFGCLIGRRRPELDRPRSGEPQPFQRIRGRGRAGAARGWRSRAREPGWRAHPAGCAPAGILSPPCRVTDANASAANALASVGVYRREVHASVDRIWENVLDWEHLPWLHPESFSRIECEHEGPSGWRARVGLAPASRTWRSCSSSTLERPALRYVARTLEGPGSGTEIWTRLAPLAPDRTQIEVEFLLPGIPAGAA